MERESVFRLMFAIILVVAFGMSGFFRRRARQSGAIARRREGGRMLFLRLLVAVPFYLAMVAFIVNPRWLDWAAVPLPTAVRWAGVAVGLATLPFLYWVLASIGHNISETVLTKSDHQLVTHGPYRWVRHPLYTGAIVAFLSLGLIAANGFLLAMGMAIWVAMATVVVPKEERHLAEKFGGAYLTYRRATGGWIPRLS